MIRLLLFVLIPTWSWAAPVFVDASAFTKVGVILLDARDAASYAKGHAPGAISAPWALFTAGPKDGALLAVPTVQARINALGVRGDRPVVIYADWRDGWGEEGRLFWMLDYLGHTDLRVIRGGIKAWRGALSRATPQTEPGNFIAKPQPSRRFEGAQILARHSALDLIDTRSPAEFAGATPYGSARGGHVPGAKLLYWKGAFEADGQLRSPEVVRAWLKAGGVDFERPAVAYCTGGIRSGFTYLLLRWLDHPAPANYDGSWWAWSKDGALPVSQ